MGGWALVIIYFLLGKHVFFQFGAFSLFSNVLMSSSWLSGPRPPHIFNILLNYILESIYYLIKKQLFNLILSRAFECLARNCMSVLHILNSEVEAAVFPFLAHQPHRQSERLDKTCGLCGKVQDWTCRKIGMGKKKKKCSSFVLSRAWLLQYHLFAGLWENISRFPVNLKIAPIWQLRKSL